MNSVIILKIYKLFTNNKQEYFMIYIGKVNRFFVKFYFFYVKSFKIYLAIF